MQYSPMAQIVALDVQRRQFDSVRLDGPVSQARPVGALRTALARVLAQASYRLAPAAQRRHIAA